MHIDKEALKNLVTAVNTVEKAKGEILPIVFGILNGMSTGEQIVNKDGRLTARFLKSTGTALGEVFKKYKLHLTCFEPRMYSLSINFSLGYEKGKHWAYYDDYVYLCDIDKGHLGKVYNDNNIPAKVYDFASVLTGLEDYYRLKESSEAELSNMKNKLRNFLGN